MSVFTSAFSIDVLCDHRHCTDRSLRHARTPGWGPWGAPKDAQSGAACRAPLQAGPACWGRRPIALQSKAWWSKDRAKNRIHFYVKCFYVMVGWNSEVIDSERNQIPTLFSALCFALHRYGAIFILSRRGLQQSPEFHGHLWLPKEEESFFVSIFLVPSMGIWKPLPYVWVCFIYIIYGLWF
jgi:hypothetical protein